MSIKKFSVAINYSHYISNISYIQLFLIQYNINNINQVLDKNSNYSKFLTNQK